MSNIGGVDRELRHGGAVCRYGGKGNGRTKGYDIHKRERGLWALQQTLLSGVVAFKRMSFEGKGHSVGYDSYMRERGM